MWCFDIELGISEIFYSSFFPSGFLLLWIIHDAFSVMMLDEFLNACIYKPFPEHMS